MMAWQNGLTFRWVYFCSRFCASKWGVSWCTPVDSIPYCELCG